MEIGFTYREAETTVEIQLPDNELGKSTHRQYEYTLKRPSLWAFGLVSCWGEERKLIGFRLNIEREWHVAPRSSHWCEDCVKSRGSRGIGLV